MEEQPIPAPPEQSKQWWNEHRDAVKYDPKQKKTAVPVPAPVKTGNVFTKKKVIPKQAVIYTEV